MTSHILSPTEQQAVLNELRIYNSYLSAIKVVHPFLNSYHFEIYDQINQVIDVLKDNHTISTRMEEFLEELEYKKEKLIERLKDHRSSCYRIAMKSSRSYNLNEERMLLKSFRAYSDALSAVQVNNSYLHHYHNCVHSQINAIFEILDFHNTIATRADEALRQVEINKLDLIRFFSDTTGYVCERSLEKQINQEPLDDEPLLAVARAHKLPSRDESCEDFNPIFESVDNLFEEWESSFKC